jgi:flagellin-like protein
MRTLLRNMKTKAARSRRAVSPVIATVILVAIAITVSVAVAYWMGGIAGSFTQFEKVEIQSGVCKWDEGTPGEWNVTIKMKNTGTATATLIGVFINEIEVDDYEYTTLAAGTTATNMTESLTIESGATALIMVYISETWESVTPGTTVNIKIHSAGGMDYVKLITLV